jgi:peptidoglycan hydrolase-like protein with peptidoglycan-binding domain
MKHISYFLFVSLLSVAAVYAQNSTGGSASVSSKASSGAKPAAGKRGPIFRANKDQIIAAQSMLKQKGIYAGEANGKLDPDTRASLRSYQKENGLRASGTLNRATLEKMGIALTDSQKAIPIPDSSYADAETSASEPNGDKPRRTIFRATKEQVIEAQRTLKAGGMYSGEETGKLDDPTREGLKKYQEAKGLKVTGTLNQATLEKMGVALTDKQKSTGGTQ